MIDDGDRRMRRTTARVESRGEGASEDDEREVMSIADEVMRGRDE